MARWLTIGQIDPEEWEALFGARWRQRAGRIMVDQAGAGFGGRSLLLSKQAPPELPYEVAVTVKLGDESGAAGLVFCADGKQKHYGFYPSAGGLRLTRFEGPDVFTWKVLDQAKTEHYRPGDWNTIRVRVEKEKLLCFVNDQLVFESTDRELLTGQVGLAKFRDTVAEFKSFRVGKLLPATAALSAETRERLAKLIADPAKPDLAAKLAPEGDAGLQLLRDRARQLEEQAQQLRQLAQDVQRQRLSADLVKTAKGKDEEIDLVHAALLVARLDNDELDVEAYRQEVERMAKKIAAALPKDADDQARLAGLNQFLFRDRGFHGSRGDYYNRSNSYLNEVIDDREGLPITLSLLYIELGRRIGLRLEGVPLPGHFVVRVKGADQFIDVYEAGAAMTRDEAAKKVESTAGVQLRDEHLKPALKRDILIRMLHNLINVARNDRDGPKMIQYLDAIIGIDPETHEERWRRAVLHAQAGHRQPALDDINWLLDHNSEIIERDKMLEFRRLLEQMER
jgi:regulator of sirC expression with transglutaminase-like and TPR domain